MSSAGLLRCSSAKGSNLSKVADSPCEDKLGSLAGIPIQAPLFNPLPC